MGNCHRSPIVSTYPQEKEGSTKGKEGKKDPYQLFNHGRFHFTGHPVEPTHSAPLIHNSHNNIAYTVFIFPQASKVAKYKTPVLRGGKLRGKTRDIYVKVRVVKVYRKKVEGIGSWRRLMEDDWYVGVLPLPSHLKQNYGASSICSSATPIACLMTPSHLIQSCLVEPNHLHLGHLLSTGDVLLAKICP